MNFCRIVAASFAIFIVATYPARSQEAVQSTTSTENPEEATPEATPIPSTEETPAPKKRTKRTEEVTEEKPAAKRLNRGVDGMTPEEFKAAGLDKLSAEELQSLDASLKGYRRNVETKATEKAKAEAKVEVQETIKKQRKSMFETLESRVDGTITRVNGNSIIRLEDGSVWKQANFEDHYQAQVVDHPQARVFRTAFGYRMRINGLPEFYVDPVRK